MKRLCLLLLTQALLFSCTTPQEKVDQQQVSHTNINSDTLAVLTPEQSNAFDALNSIQVQGHHLYSTFSGIHHDCFPPDTSFVVSRAALQMAMEELLEQYYTSIQAEQRTKLVATAVLAQETYLVLKCNDYSDDKTKNVLQSGSWILPEVLDRRDVILVW